MRHLYEIAPDLKEALTILDDFTGEVEGVDEDALLAAMAAVEQEFDRKIESCAHVRQEAKAQAEFYRKEKQRIEVYQRAAERKVAWLERYIAANMDEAGRDKVVGETITVTRTKARVGLFVLDEKMVPSAFLRDPQVDKAALNAEYKGKDELPPWLERRQGERGLRFR